MNNNKKELPRAYEQDVYPWHVGLTHDIYLLGKGKIQHPARACAIFVVHGMGLQQLTETAATLRFGFEDALEEIENRISKTDGKLLLGDPRRIPPPWISEGYWADYDNLQDTFPQEWKHLEPRKQMFFSSIWKLRSISITRTFFWFLFQQLRLLSLKILVANPLAWVIYFLLQFVSFTALFLVRIFAPGVLSRVLGDVRLYAAPKGITERAIVQRIDYRVGDEFLRMLGLDWNFRARKNPKETWLQLNGKPIRFKRIIWVAHSLGSVISYNVLSDLFERAASLKRHGDKEQQRNVDLFRDALRRFVTLGSPLDKISFLFGKRALRPWAAGSRESLLTGGETVKQKDGVTRGEWWIDFYHVLDPVSGALNAKLICGDEAPVNIHIKLFKYLPGLAHVGYWRDPFTLRYVLSRAYGKEFLEDEGTKVQSAALKTFYALVGYVVWFSIIYGLAWAIVVGVRAILTMIV